VRFVTWNCAIGQFRGKAKAIAPLKPDVLAVQEVESLDGVLLFAGDEQPTYRDRPAPAESRRAIAVFSYTGVELQPVPTNQSNYSFCRYDARYKDRELQVAAVWTWQTADRATSYKQAHQGIQRYAEWIKQRPTVVLGDFNNNQIYRGGKWQDLAESLNDLGLVSAYHAFFSEPFGFETRPTHFHRRDSTKPFHIDYCFVPAQWRDHITRVEVGKPDEWRAYSDHVPLIVDIDI
jgi:endonuclease/exonuclease/phosphatase family metal-dependent hydrolase